MSSRHRAALAVDDELLRIEREVRAEGFRFIAGVDEAGRGPLAGPVVAAAVILPESGELPGVFDSKALSAAVRDELYAEITTLPGVDFAIGTVDAEEIDRLNILNATHLAMRKAVEGLRQVDFVLVDGLPVKGLPVRSRNIIKGDARCAAVAAASIIAKTCRDRIMVEADSRYPGYGFAAHKGYGCAAHVEALMKLGPCPLHRRSFRPVRMAMEEPGSTQLELDI